jgi:error-prone DNA polymerase
VFLTLEDETGNTNVLVWTSILERYRAVLLQGQLLRIKGTVEREGEVVHLIAGHVIDNTTLLETLGHTGNAVQPFSSRDFH